MWAKKYLTFHLSQSASSIISGSPSQQVWEQKHESINISSHPRITPISELTKPQPKPWFSFGNHLSLTVIIVVIGGGVVHSFTTLHFYLHKYFKPSFCISILSVCLSVSLSLSLSLSHTDWNDSSRKRSDKTTFKQCTQVHRATL